MVLNIAKFIHDFSSNLADKQIDAQMTKQPPSFGRHTRNKHRTTTNTTTVIWWRLRRSFNKEDAT